MVGGGQVSPLSKWMLWHVGHQEGHSKLQQAHQLQDGPCRVHQQQKISFEGEFVGHPLPGWKKGTNFCA